MRYAIVAALVAAAMVGEFSAPGSTTTAASAQQPSRPAAPQAKPAPPANRFEVSSVARNTSGETAGGIPTPAGNAFLANNVTFEELVRWAYGVGAYRHLPRSWEPPRRWTTLDLTNVDQTLLKARFEIRGKAPSQPREPESGSLGAFHYMVQTLLAERFKLAVRWEPRERQTYLLTMEAPNPQPDPALRDLVDGCLVSVKERDRCDCGSQAGGTDPTCRVAWRSGDIGISGRGVTMVEIARSLSSSLNNEVVDRTGQTGRFDVVLRLSPGSPLMRDALRRQFGLGLEPRTSAGEALVIVSAEMPID